MSTIKHASLFACIMLLFASCGDDDSPGPSFSTETFEATVNINPNNFPAGAGLNLALGDTGKTAQLDAEANFAWDIKMITYRTSQGGRPAIFLQGDNQSSNPVKALNVSAHSNIALGSAGFAEFETVTEAMQEALQADGVFNFDPATDVDAMGKPDLTLLQAAYQNLNIGDKVVNLGETEQPIFLVQIADGAFFKFQLVRRENGGSAVLRWARFGQSSIN